MIHMHQTQPGGAGQPQLVCASGLHPFTAAGLDTRMPNTTRKAEPSPPRRTSPHHTETPLTTTPGRPRDAAPTRQPGAWPDACKRTQPGDQAWMRHQAERAEREVFLGVVQADLEQQPTERAVRAAGRRWCREITQLANEVADSMREAA